EFFANAACDASGNGERKRFLGSTTVNTDASGNATINAMLASATSAGAAVTATATDASGNTPGFSACGSAGTGSSATLGTRPDAHPAGTFTVTVTAFDSGGLPTQKTFMLTVTTPATCNPITFAATNFGAGTAPRSLAVGDFNGDGKQDLAVANQNSNNMSVLLGNGAGSFSAATNFGVGSSPRSMAVGDFNGDGKQDLAVSNINSNNVSVLLGDGAGSFSAAINFSVGANPSSVAVGD